ncbi:hypothetical protein O3G_MSEX014256 [Manduca sexta]|uniref:Uncharacterized protein n=1 Tax=Manduca sexta TaxID=7130 RepID=A0A921ZTY0_MANSE|nr:hypothetical protein O3G_MSEX014256 [Manduca sexta]
MAISGCSSGLLATAVVALLLLPVQYYVPDLYSGIEEPLSAEAVTPPGGALAWLDQTLAAFPSLDLFMAAAMLILGIITYVYEWIQRKLLERRIMKLNHYLGASIDRLRAWDAQQEQLESTLKMVQNATSEYNLLLYLLLRQHRCLAAHHAPPSNCFFDKPMEEDLTYLRAPTIIEA